MDTFQVDSVSVNLILDENISFLTSLTYCYINSS